MAEAQTISAIRRGIELPLVLFALITLLTVVMPSRERSLLPLDTGDLAGFLAESAANERLPDPFGVLLDDPVARTGFAIMDGSARLLNPVLRSGGAAPRTRSRNIPGSDRNGPGSGALPGEASSGNPSDVVGGDRSFAAVDPGMPGSPGTGTESPSGSGGGGTNPGNIVGGGPLPSVGDLVSIAVLGSVPEPATWMLMIFGFGAMGRLLRRRRARIFSAG